jgi:hypothetical protein
MRPSSVPNDTFSCGTANVPSIGSLNLCVTKIATAIGKTT